MYGKKFQLTMARKSKNYLGINLRGGKTNVKDLSEETITEYKRMI